MRDVIENPQFPWDIMYGISMHPHFSLDVVKHYPTKEFHWYEISRLSHDITMQDIENHPEYPWEWNCVFGVDFVFDRQLYVNNQLGRVLLVSMLDEYTKQSANAALEQLSLLVLHNDYHLSHILPYI